MMFSEAARRGYRALAVTALAIGWAAAAQAQAHTHAHTHGQLEMEVAIDAEAITVRLDAPLHDLVGFERAPRSVAERGRVTALTEQLKAADKLFVLDPAAGCTLADVTIDSAVLGLGAAAAQAASAPKDQPAPEHADLALTAQFVCEKADAARFVDVKLFDAFKGVRTIAAQVAGPHGQFGHSLRRGAARLSLDTAAK